MNLKQTPLFNKHNDLKARMAEFAGFSMPISYDAVTGGMLKEHLAVRKDAGIFDISHMGEFWIKGDQATEFLSYVCTRSFSQVVPFKAVYCLLLHPGGGIVDDIIVYKVNDQTYWMVVNASNMTKDWNHLKALAEGFKVSLEDVSEKTALIAIQGPRAKEILPKFYPGIEKLKYYTFEQRDGLIIARTGYTGEDGFEVFLPNQDAPALWSELEKTGALPIGLGARDTLRLEVGFPLYGHELSDTLNPSETLSAFAVESGHSYVGKGKGPEPKFKPIAVKTDNPKPLRAEEKLYLNGKVIGHITSGSMSPVLRVGIGLALIDKNAPINESSIFALDSAGKPRQAIFSELPFVATERTKKRPQKI